MEKNKPFRFGLEIGGATSRQEWLDKARRIEDLGFSTVLLEDHLSCAFAPLAALVSAAEVTSTLRIGTYVLGNDFRHPIVVAKEAATIDVLSNGRLELGMGTGYYKPDYERSGIPLQPPGIRIDRFKEAIKVVKGFFSGETFSFEGQYYQIHDLKGVPLSVQKPYPPIMIGGGSKRILGIAAQEANIVSLNIRTTPEGGFDLSSLTAEAAAQKVEWIRDAAGERFADLELNLLVLAVAITDDRRSYAEEMHKDWGMPDDTFTVNQLLDSPSFLIGSEEQIIEQLHMLREKYCISYYSIWEPMDPFAPIVARLSGK